MNTAGPTGADSDPIFWRLPSNVYQAVWFAMLSGIAGQLSTGTTGQLTFVMTAVGVLTLRLWWLRLSGERIEGQIARMEAMIAIKEGPDVPALRPCASVSASCS